MLHVLDASALLALMQSEPGSEVVDALLEDHECVASSVNIAEVGSKLVDKGLAPDQLSRVLSQIDVQTIDFDAEQATACAALRASRRKAARQRPSPGMASAAASPRSTRSGSW